MPPEDIEPTADNGHAADIQGALSFLKAPTVYITVQSYRDNAFDARELNLLGDHLDSWRALLAKHGIAYDGMTLDGTVEGYPGLIYYSALPVDTENFPAALPLVEDALYELTELLPDAGWNINAVEQLITPLKANDGLRGLIPAQPLLSQRSST